MDTATLTAMAAFYAALDGEIAALALECRGCGECCRFDRADHILYASRLEREYLLASDPLPDSPDADPDLLSRGLACPYQKGGRCHARRGRTLGCRLHFCIGSDRPADGDMAEQWHQRLKDLHRRLGVEWEYARLLPLPPGQK